MKKEDKAVGKRCKTGKRRYSYESQCRDKLERNVRNLLAEHAEFYDCETAYELREAAYSIVLKKMHLMRYPNLCMIARPGSGVTYDETDYPIARTVGKTGPQEIHGRAWLEPHLDPQSMIIRIAATTILTAAWDIISERRYGKVVLPKPNTNQLTLVRNESDLLQ